MTQSPADVQAGVDAALKQVEDLVAADEDLVHGDVVEQVALELPLDVAIELCEQAMGFVPDTVRHRIFLAQHEDTIRTMFKDACKAAGIPNKSAHGIRKAAATRAQTLAKEAAVNAEKLKSSTCMSCFQVRTPAGTCGCDE